MTARDLFAFSLRALTGHGLRTGLSVLGVMVGVAAVVLLTALGEGARRYVIGQFAGLGTNLLVVVPGRTETTGVPGTGGVPNDLTLQDGIALQRAIPAARRVAPVSMGTEEVAFGEKRRQVALVGTTSEYLLIRELELKQGRFVPALELTRGAPVVTLGHKVARELFGTENPVGRIVRIGGWRMRVIGVLKAQGTTMGIDFDEIVVVPVATAMQMLNRTSLFRIILQTRSHTALDSTKEQAIQILYDRHGEHDVTVLTQDALVTTFSSILNVLTLALGAIGAVSLTVAGVGIMNVMLVSVSERQREVGLLKALGTSRRQILSVFLTEAILLSSAGGLLGLSLGWLGVKLLVQVFPALPASPPIWAVVTALTVSIGVGAIFGVLPARRASRLNPVDSLTGR